MFKHAVFRKLSLEVKVCICVYNIEQSRLWCPRKTLGTTLRYSGADFSNLQVIVSFCGRINLETLDFFAFHLGKTLITIGNCGGRSFRCQVQTMVQTFCQELFLLSQHSLPWFPDQFSFNIYVIIWLLLLQPWQERYHLLIKNNCIYWPMLQILILDISFNTGHVVLIKNLSIFYLVHNFTSWC